MLVWRTSIPHIQYYFNVLLGSDHENEFKIPHILRTSVDTRYSIVCLYIYNYKNIFVCVCTTHTRSCPKLYGRWQIACPSVNYHRDIIIIIVKIRIHLYINTHIYIYLHGARCVNNLSVPKSNLTSVYVYYTALVFCCMSTFEVDFRIKYIENVIPVHATTSCSCSMPGRHNNLYILIITAAFPQLVY
jgi:hypothetical protein